MLAIDVQRSNSGMLPPGKEHVMVRSISTNPVGPPDRMQDRPATDLRPRLTLRCRCRAVIGARIRTKRLLRAVAAGAALLALAGASGAASAVASSPSLIVTGPDHQRLSVVPAPGTSSVFKLPKTNDPVRIDITYPSTNDAVRTPSEVLGALADPARTLAQVGGYPQKTALQRTASFSAARAS